MILNFKVYWNTLNSIPFINETVPIVANADNQTLCNFIRHEIVTVRPNIAYADEDIKAIKSVSGANKLRIMHYPVDTYIASIAGESPQELKVVIDRNVQQPQPTVNAYNRMMVASVPVTTKYTSKRSLDDVLSFQSGYEAAPNKEVYLKSAQHKPNIDEQHEAFIVSFLNDSNLGYKGGTGGEEKVANDALKLAVQSLKFVNKYRGTMGRSRITLYDSSKLLRDVKGCVSAKTKKEKLPQLTKDLLVSEIEKLNKALNAFPSSYYRVFMEGRERHGEPIIKEMAIWKDIMGKYFEDLVKQEIRDKARDQNVESNRPSSFNSDAIVIPSKM